MATDNLVGVAHTVIIGIIVDHSSGTIGGSRAGVARVNGVGAASVGIGGGAVVVAGARVLATGDFIGIADPIIVGIVVHDGTSHTRLTNAIHIRAGSIGIRCGSVVVACGVVLTAKDFVGVTDTIVVGIIVDNDSTFTRFTNAVHVGTSACISGSCIVIACGVVLASNNFVGVTHAVIVGVVVDHCSSAVGGSGARIAGVSGEDAASVGIGGSAVVVACGVVLAAGNLVGVADSIIVGVVVHDGSANASFTDAIRVGAGSIGVRCGSVVIARGVILTTGDFVSVADSIVVGVVVHDGACHAGLADSVHIGTGASVGGSGIVVAGGIVLTTDDFVGIADTVIIRIVVDDRTGSIRGTGTGLTDSIGIGATAGVRGRTVVVAGGVVLAAGDFVGIADAVIIRIIVNYRSGSVRFAGAGLTDAIRVEAHARIGGVSIEVARGVVLASHNFIRVTNTIVIGIVVHDRSRAIRLSRAGVAGVNGVGAASVGIGGSTVVVACGIVLATGDFVIVAHAIIIGIVVHDRSRTVRRSRTRVAGVGGVGAVSVGIGCGTVVVARSIVLATRDFIGIADAVVVGVVVDNGSRSSRV